MTKGTEPILLNQIEADKYRAGMNNEPTHKEYIGMSDQSLHTLEDLVEQLAAIEHERWADWQAWCHKVLRENVNCGEMEKVLKRWDKQIAKPYDKLTKREKQSDRDQVARYLPLLNNKIREVGLEVIGEDEQPIFRIKTEVEQDFCTWRNQLRDEQRQRLDSLLNETKQ